MMDFSDVVRILKRQRRVLRAISKQPNRAKRKIKNKAARKARRVNR